MDTEKHRLTQAGWINLVQDVRDGTWHGLHRGQGGWWLCHDLLKRNGARRDDWHDDEDYERALKWLEALKVQHRYVLSAEDWGSV